MMRPLRDASKALGLWPTVAALVGLGLGVVALVVGWATGHGAVALGALDVGWLYCAGIAAGGVALSAAIRLSQGRWARAVTPVAEATSGFYWPALALLVLLVLAAPSWIPDAAREGRGAWGSRVARDVGAGVILFLAGELYVRRTRAGRETATAAIVYLLLYVITLSLWAVDLVMGLSDWAPSTVIPPFYFIGALLGGLALTALLSALRRPETVGPPTRHDLGKLLFAFVIFWGYLAWAAYLPVWYGNMPEETGQLLARWADGWRGLTMAVLLTVLAFPFFFFLPEANKRGRSTIVVGAASILVGLLGERMLLVLPSLRSSLSAAEVVITLGVLLGVGGLFLVSFGARLASAPPIAPAKGAPADPGPHG